MSYQCTYKGGITIETYSAGAGRDVASDRTDIDEAKEISACQHKSKFNFELFRKKYQFISVFML